MYLALGCCRGVAAMHQISASFIHRDIKSFNFLVDSQLMVKVADLELGSTSTEGADELTAANDNLRAPNNGVNNLFRSSMMMSSWQAPEVGCCKHLLSACHHMNLCVGDQG
jgi:serine/threonine protein kinase